MKKGHWNRQMIQRLVPFLFMVGACNILRVKFRNGYKLLKGG
jgi:hypothetical protein